MRVHVDWNWPISREKYLKIDWSVKLAFHCLLWELQAPRNVLLVEFKMAAVLHCIIVKCVATSISLDLTQFTCKLPTSYIRSYLYLK